MCSVMISKMKGAIETRAQSYLGYGAGLAALFVAIIFGIGACGPSGPSIPARVVAWDYDASGVPMVAVVKNTTTVTARAHCYLLGKDEGGSTLESDEFTTEPIKPGAATRVSRLAFTKAASVDNLA